MEAREFKDAVFEQLARVGAALGSAKRVEVVELLAQGERSVESIAAAAAMTVGNTSRHLQILKAAGLVTSRRDGLRVRYRVADESVVAGYLELRALAESRVAEVRLLAQAFFGQVDGAEPVGLDELRALSGEVTLIDVRPRLEFDAGHLPGAMSIPLEDLATRMAELDPGMPVVAYCRGPYCVLAAQAVVRLRDAGLTAQRLAGGPPDWHAAGLPLASGT